MRRWREAKSTWQLMIDRKLQLELLTRPRLARIAGPSGAHLLSALFERSRPSDVWIDAPQFRIDYEDQRNTIQDLSSKRFVVTSWDGNEEYRLSLPALALVDSESACSLLNIIDRLLAYLVRQYKAQRDQRIPVARISKDLQLSRESIVTALRYLVDTPAIGTRASGDPGSKPGKLGRSARWRPTEVGTAPATHRLSRAAIVQTGPVCLLCDCLQRSATRPA